ncbi:MAG: helix-turn-helix domain-containing protein [Dokdonella sp.]
MEHYSVDTYVLDVLLPDLVGHDHKPGAFLVYLCLLSASERGKTASLTLSLQDLAARTGLAKSTVQGAIRHLKRRGLLDADVVASTTQPIRRIKKPWVR